MLSRPTFHIRHLLAMLLLGIVLLLPLLAYLGAPTQLERIRKLGELKVVTLRSPTTYYESDGEPAGFEYELASAFADYLGLRLSLTALDSIAALEEALRLNDAHIAAAGLSVTGERRARFRFGPSYHESHTWLVYRMGEAKPESLAQLQGRLEVVARSSHAQLLARLAPPESWQEAEEGRSVADLLQAVNDGALDYTLVDAIEYEVQKVYYPRLAIAFEVGEPLPIAWMLKKGQDASLIKALEEFFALPETRALLETLRQRYFSADQRLGFVDSITFQKHLEERLPPLRDWFEQAAAETGFPWQLLAAIGYQESHWNPKAVSPTGVRGVMMLTRTTAKRLGIRKRTDPQQSILGGARYFAELYRRLPARIQDPDRTLLALAAYNVGRGHLEDARILTQRAGDDPDRWEDVSKHLPKLSDPRWYQTVKHGFARGQEPVIYVRNIQRYWQQLELLSRKEAAEAAEAATEPPAGEGGDELTPRLPERLPDTL